MSEVLAARAVARRRVPVATYRLQLDRTFTFEHARDLVPYLVELGITDCYLSPFLAPCAQDSHGYDIADHGRINEALGGEAGYRAFSDALRAHGLGQLIDVVPNHMGISGAANVWWLDVLENGPASPYAPFFDIDWEPVKPELQHKVLLPILGDQYGRVLERQELRLELLDGAFLIRYQDTVLPIGPRTYAQILRHRLPELETELRRDDPQLLELQSIITATSHLPARTDLDAERRAERAREKQIVKRRLDALVRESPAVKRFVDENLRVFNGVQGDPGSFDRLDALLAEQAYRVAYWGVAADEINYRRFFDVNGLAAIRMEEPAVFEAAHRLVLRLVDEGRVTGFRIDHPDGLYAPAQYLRDLRARCGEDFYLVVEKILMRGESLPERWPVDGTTGYEFLNALGGLFVDPGAARAFDRTYRRFTGWAADFDELVYATKKLITDTTMASEINVLGGRLARLSAKHRVSRDFTDRSLTDVLREIIACFPVYRTYIGEDGFTVGEQDRRYVAQAVARAKHRNPTTSASVFDFVRDMLCLELVPGRTEVDRAEGLAFVMKFQQLTGPIAAKGVEDTAFYRYNRLVSLNEVGGAPDRFGASVDEFHRLNARRLARWPGSLSATSTHDTKRSEDVRARIHVLSELPRLWGERLRAWYRLNRRLRSTVDGHEVPDRSEEYLLYQTLLGAWPLEPVTDADHAAFTERMQRYRYKALHEAKVHVSWVNPNPEYDAAVRRFVTAILDRNRPNPFLADFLPFQRQVATWGMYNSLSQTLLKLAAPGVPDVYQGTELWDLSLVDPDNRRPVDYARRRTLLADLRAAIAAAGADLAPLARELVETLADGRAKLYLTHRVLDYRRRHAELFGAGEYVPLEPAGARREHLCAFARRLGAALVVAVAPRWLARLGLDGPPLGSAWEDTWLGLPPEEATGRYRNVLTGETVPVAEHLGQPTLPVAAVFASFPVALLEREGGR